MYCLSSSINCISSNVLSVPQCSVSPLIYVF
jgi:hypothetical protein